MFKLKPVSLVQMKVADFYVSNTKKMVEVTDLDTTQLRELKKFQNKHQAHYFIISPRDFFTFCYPC